LLLKGGSCISPRKKLFRTDEVMDGSSLCLEQLMQDLASVVELTQQQQPPQLLSQQKIATTTTTSSSSSLQQQPQRITTTNTTSSLQQQRQQQQSIEEELKKEKEKTETQMRVLSETVYQRSLLYLEINGWLSSSAQQLLSSCSSKVDQTIQSLENSISLFESLRLRLLLLPARPEKESKK